MQKLTLKPTLPPGCLSRDALEQIVASITVNPSGILRQVQYSPTPPPDTTLPWQKTDPSGGFPVGPVRHYKNGSWQGLTSGTVVTGPRGPQGVPGISQGTIVQTFDQLQAALALSATKITLHADITLGADIVIPYETNVTVVPYRIKQNLAGTRYKINWYGYLPPIRTQIFQDFIVDEIRGPFGDGTSIPEWWGLVGSTIDNGEHDLAINCAIRSNMDGAFSTTASLAGRVYYVKRPLDLRGTKSRIRGASSSSSYIRAVKNFDPGVWIWSGIFASILPNMQSNFSAVSSESSGNRIKLTTDAGGCTEYYEGQMAAVSGSVGANYNGSWEVHEVPAHNEVILNKAFDGTATGTVTPITLDSVMETGDGSATSLVLLGSDTAWGGKTFYTGIERVSVEAYYATVAWPLKRVHCISWTGWVEEQSFIRDVLPSGFSGFGIGGENSTGVVVVNGMTAQNFHISEGMRRGAIGIYAPPHGGCLAFREGTVNCFLQQAYSRAAIGALPDNYTREYPQFGCVAAGVHTEFDGVHVEGVGNAFHVFATGGGCAVSIVNCDHNHLMDWGMLYYNDEVHRKQVPDLVTQMSEDNLGNRHAFLYHTSCGISIGRRPDQYESANNYDSRVHVVNYSNAGLGIYMLRDWIYNVDFTTYGGRFPHRVGRGVNFYSRGIPYGTPWQGRITAAALHASGTLLTVVSSAGLIAGNTVFITPDGETDDEYDPSALVGWVVHSVPSGTTVVIVKTWSDTLTGALWRAGAYYDRNSPPVDRQYFIGPIW